MSSQRIPKLEAEVGEGLFSHNVALLAVWHTSTKDQEGFEITSLLLIDIREEVGEGNCMLFVIATAEVKEFLSGCPQIWHILEHTQIFNVRDHRDKSGNALDGILVSLSLLG